MATLQEQRQAAEDPTLRVKVREACIVSAQKIVDEPAGTANHPNRLAWAKLVLVAPDTYTDRMLAYIIAKNNASTLAQILAASDATVQQNVDGAVDAFA